MSTVIDPIVAREHIAENVRWCMEHVGVSLTELAEATGSHITTIHRLRKAENDPAFTLVARIADYFHVTTDDLMLPAAEFRRVYQRRQAAREPVTA